MIFLGYTCGDEGEFCSPPDHDLNVCSEIGGPDDPFAEDAAHFGLIRVAYYGWRNRYLSHGLEALSDYLAEYPPAIRRPSWLRVVK